MFCEESLGKINKCALELFRSGSVHEFSRLKELITLEQVNTSVSLVMSMRFIFGDDLNDVPCSHHDVLSLEFSCNYTRVTRVLNQFRNKSSNTM